MPNLFDKLKFCELFAIFKIADSYEDYNMLMIGNFKTCVKFASNRYFDA